MSIDREELKNEYPLIGKMERDEEILWLNANGYNSDLDTEEGTGLSFSSSDIDDAEKRLNRFAPYIRAAFPETGETGGIIESPLVEIPKMKRELEGEISGRLFLKMDSHLKVSGSVKARGGIYEVLKFAEEVAIERGMLSPDDDYSIIMGDEFRKLFSEYSIAVGSTGNLGLSIGIISAKLGFNVTVHMSADARQWKKELLREKGVKVVEYDDDYQKAVAEGRRLAEGDPYCHFVDDEGSRDLFLGYSVAPRRLIKQLKEAHIVVDYEYPLFVYIPCGVGGAPGGVTYGLKEQFGKNVHVFFAEPTHAPCMTLGMMTRLHDGISVKDIGIDGRTAADGLAVARPSRLVGSVMMPLLEGCYTVADQRLYPYLAKLRDSEGISIEPSACASFPGPGLICSEQCEEYRRVNGLEGKMENATHIIWATGGSMVPEEEMEHYYNLGKVTKTL